MNKRPCVSESSLHIMHCWGERACIRSLLWIRLWVLNTSMAKFPEENFNSSKYLYKEKGGQWPLTIPSKVTARNLDPLCGWWKRVKKWLSPSTILLLWNFARSWGPNLWMMAAKCFWRKIVSDWRGEKSLGKLKPRGSFPTQLSSQKMAEKLLPTLPKALGWMRSICFKIDFHEP